MIKFIKKHPFLFILLIVAIAGVGFTIYYIKKSPNVNYTASDLEEVKKLDYTYADNEYKIIEIDEKVTINNYYKEILYLILNDHETLYNMLTSDNKKAKFNDSYEKFDAYMDDITTVDTRSNVVNKYHIVNNTSTNDYYVIDTEGNYITIHEKNVWDITIEFNGKVTGIGEQ